MFLRLLATLSHILHGREWLRNRPRRNRIATSPLAMTSPRLATHRLDQFLKALRLHHLLLGLALIDLAVRGVHLLQHARGLGGELAPGADLVAVLPENDGKGDTGQR